MNDDELPINAELASAYLDGELDAAERASAAADPAVASVIESFAQVRAALGEIGPVADSTRTAAIAAALAEFDATHKVGSATAIVTSLQSRRVRAYRVLSGVAAAAVIGVIAIAALNSTGGNDSKSSSGTAPPAAAVPAEAPQVKAAADTSAAAGTAAPAGATADSSTVTVPAIDSAAALRQYAASFASGNTTAAASPPAATSPPASLAAAGAATAAPTAGLPPPFACLAPNQFVIGQIFFQGTPAFAVRDTSNDHIQAIAAADCRVLLDVAP